MYIPNTSIDKFVNISTNMELRPKWDDKLKEAKLITKISETSDIYHLKISMPFPIKNRDAVQKRVILCNKTHPELIKKYGLPEKEHKYYIIINEPIGLVETQPTSDYERSYLFAFYMIEEIPSNPSDFKVTMIGHSDLGGMVPTWLVNWISVKAPNKIMSNIISKMSEFEK